MEKLKTSSSISISELEKKLNKEEDKYLKQEKQTDVLKEMVTNLTDGKIALTTKVSLD